MTTSDDFPHDLYQSIYSRLRRANMQKECDTFVGIMTKLHKTEDAGKEKYPGIFVFDEKYNTVNHKIAGMSIEQAAVYNFLIRKSGSKWLVLDAKTLLDCGSFEFEFEAVEFAISKSITISRDVNGISLNFSDGSKLQMMFEAKVEFDEYFVMKSTRSVTITPTDDVKWCTWDEGSITLFGIIYYLYSPELVFALYKRFG